MAADDPRRALAEIRNRLSEDRRKQEIAARQKTEKDALARREAGLFRAVVGDATPINQPNRAVKAVKPPPPVPLRRSSATEPEAAQPSSFSDGVDSAMPIGEDAPFSRDGVAPQTLRKLRRGDPPAQGTLDLHGMNRDQARNALSTFLQRALQDGSRCVRIVHGKGISSIDGQPVLKSLVRRWLTQSGQVLAYVPAHPAEGGDGALLVLLQPRG
jgi:DNA-nicking Smr family endonuclease